MAISLIGTTGGLGGAASTSAVINYPSGTQAGDLVLVHLELGGQTGATATPPSGWTTVETLPAVYNLGEQTSIVFAKIAGSETSATFTLSPSQYWWATAAVYRGVDSSAPIDASAASARVSGTSITAPTVTTSSPGDQIVYCVLAAAVNGTWTADPATTLEVESDQNRMALFDENQASAGTSTARTFILSASANMAAATVALKPASSGSTVSISASGASASGGAASSAVARPTMATTASDFSVVVAASALRSIAASGASASASSGAASARRAGGATLTSDSAVAGLVAVLRSTVVSIASRTTNAALTLARRAVGATGASVSAVSASASVVGSAILGAAASVSATTISATASVGRGVSAVSDAVSGVLGDGALRRVAAALSASVAAIQVVGQVAGSTLVASATIAITLDMELADTVVIEAGLSDAVELEMPLEEV